MRKVSTFLFLVIGLFLFFKGVGIAEDKPQGYFEKAPVIRPFYDKYWCLIEDFSFTTKEGKIIIVPAGFVTDLASVPAAATPIFDEFGRYSSAGIIHDYLYWEKIVSKEEADRIIKEALKATGVKSTRRNTMKLAVKLFGQTAWDNNCKERNRKYPRVIPAEYRVFPPSTKWKEYQQKIMEKGIFSSENPNCKD